MADNVEITAGRGTIIATDEVDGIQYQRTIITLEVAGTGIFGLLSCDHDIVGA